MCMLDFCIFQEDTEVQYVYITKDDARGENNSRALGTKTLSLKSHLVMKRKVEAFKGTGVRK